MTMCYLKAVRTVYYVRYAILIVRLGGMRWSQTGATNYQTQLGLTDKVRAIKGLVFCYVVWLV